MLYVEPSARPPENGLTQASDDHRPLHWGSFPLEVHVSPESNVKLGFSHYTQTHTSSRLSCNFLHRDYVVCDKK